MGSCHEPAPRQQGCAGQLGAECQQGLLHSPARWATCSSSALCACMEASAAQSSKMHSCCQGRALPRFIQQIASFTCATLKVGASLLAPLFAQDGCSSQPLKHENAWLQASC